jgi:hypothetical protein
VGSRNDEGTPVRLVTDLSEDELRQLYRRRWQVELFIQRMKSLANLGDLPTRDGPTARSWIRTKLLLALLATLMAHESFSPWGYPEAQGPAQPVENRCLRTVGDHKSPSGIRSSAQ